MTVIQNVQTIVAASALIILDLIAVVKAITVIISKVKAVQSASTEEQEAAKENVTENLQQIIFGLVADAEKELGAGTGKLKSAKVAGWIYDKIPDSLKALYTATEIQNMIDSVLTEAQAYWAKNSSAAAYISGNATIQALTGETVESAINVEQVATAVAAAIVEVNKASAQTPQGTDGETPTQSENAAEAATEATTETAEETAAE